MTNPDSFGQEVSVGDYVYFRVKTKYAADALSLGRVTKISPKGGLTLTAINTRGNTVEAYVAYQDKRWADYNSRPGYVPTTTERPHYFAVTYKQVLASASSCVKVPAYVLPPGLIQVLQE